MKAHLKLITTLKKMIDLYDSGATFCAFDTETSGVNPSNERIIEIGAVKFSKDGITETFSQLVNPEKSLSPYTTQLTGITDSMLCDAPSAIKVIPQFREFCKDTILIAHNAQFDLRFINAESQRLDLFPLQNQAIDTLRLSRIMLPDNKTWKQAALAHQFNIDTGHEHRAFDDARACGKLFEVLIRLSVPPKKKKRKSSDQQSEEKPYNLNTASLATQALL